MILALFTWGGVTSHASGVFKKPEKIMSQPAMGLNTQSNVQFKTLRAIGAVGLALLSIVVVAGAGCSRPPYPPGYPGQYPVGQYQAGAPVAGQAALAAPTGPGSVFAGQQTNPQLVESQRRAEQLDANNRQLTTQVAQAQQQNQLLRERNDLLTRQLQDLTAQNRQLTSSQQQIAANAQNMQQSMSLRGGARLTANNSVTNSSSGLQIAGARVVPDGDLVRIRIPADQLFSPGTAQPNPAGSMMLDQIASALTRRYPRQRVAIEGHTDTTPMYGGMFGTPYQLASGQAQAVMDQLVRRNGVPTQQLFTVAHGPNHPIADNQSPAGRAENRRIEIVIYPETF